MKNRNHRIQPGDFVKKPRDKEGVYIFLSKFLSGRAKLMKYSDLSSDNNTVCISELTKSRSVYNLSVREYITQLLIDDLERSTPEVFSSIGGARTKFKPFQFRPLLKYMDSPNDRLLIADEVGLGKTIEAGYILIEEMAKNPLTRVLIICPSHLRYKWKWEMSYRFGIPFRIVNGQNLLEKLGEDGTFYYIVSMDSMRNGKLNQLKNKIFLGNNPLDIERDELDFLIIDEIHHLIGRSGLTCRRDFGLMLSSSAKRCLGLSATPIHLGEKDLKRVLEVIRGRRINKERFDRHASFGSLINQINKELMKTEFDKRERKKIVDMINDKISKIEEHKACKDSGNLGDYLTIKQKVRQGLEGNTTEEERFELARRLDQERKFYPEINRSRRVDVGEDRVRKVHTEPLIELSKEEILDISEHELFFKLDKFFKENFYHVHRQQLSSCLIAMYGLLKNGMRGFNTWQYEGETLTEYEYNKKDKDEKGRGKKQSLDKDDISRAKDLCDELNRVQFLGDTKLNKMIDRLKELKDKGKIRKAIVFTRWVPTMEYLINNKSELEEGLETNRVFFVKGDERRTEAIRNFEKYDGFTVLFANDVLSEGVDIISADCIVNYDLPYNPQRLEQRIGRVDRIGQESDEIHIINLIVKNSMDYKILKRIHRPIKAFEMTLGPMGNLLFERHVKGERIDELDSIALKKEAELLNQIIEREEFVGVNEYLDDKIKELKEKDETELERKILIQEFSKMMEGSNINIVTDEDGFKIEGNTEGLGELLAEVYCSSLNRHDQYHEIKNLISSIDRLTLKYDGEGEYLSLNHPIFIGMKELLCVNDSRNIEDKGVPYLSIEGDIDLINERETLIITNYEINFNGEYYKEYTVWKYNQEIESLEKMDEVSIAELFGIIKDLKIELGFEDNQQGLSKAKQLIEESFHVWCKDRTTRYKVNRKLTLEDKLNRLEYKRYKITKNLKEKDNKHLEQMIKILDKKINKTEELSAELQEEGDDLGEKKLRIPLIIYGDVK